MHHRARQLFATKAQRLARHRELAETFSAITRLWESAALLRALGAAGIPSGPINTYSEIFADPQA